MTSAQYGHVIGYKAMLTSAFKNVKILSTLLITSPYISVKLIEPHLDISIMRTLNSCQWKCSVDFQQSRIFDNKKIILQKYL